MNRLSEIFARKRERVAGAKALGMEASLKLAAQEYRAHANAHRLLVALTEDDGTKIIAEFKRRSPSKGAIAQVADPMVVARQYEAGEAAAVSVLTEEDYFHGSLDDLRAMRKATRLPILRKDFIFDEYQIYESAAAGADALLLITAVLQDRELDGLRRLTEDELGMDALVEVHTPDEMKRAVACGAKIIGVNNRDLTTFQVSLETSIKLAAFAPSNIFLISESGIAGREDIEWLQRVGYRGFLIGETLMRANNRESTLREFVAGRKPAGV